MASYIQLPGDDGEVYQGLTHLSPNCSVYRQGLLQLPGGGEYQGLTRLSYADLAALARKAMDLGKCMGLGQLWRHLTKIVGGFLD